MIENEEKLKKLRDRWHGEQERIEKIVKAMKEKEDWTVHLEGLPYVDEIEPIPRERYGRDLRGIDLRKRELREIELPGAHLEGACLREAHLEEAKLMVVHLEGADLWNVHLEGAILTKAHFEGAVLLGAHLERASLREAHCEKAKFWDSDLEKAYLRDTHLEGAELNGASLENAFVSSVKSDRKTKCRGIRVATCYGSPRFKRFAQDQDYLEELQSTRWGKFVYWLWLISCDCGRSVWPWLVWSVLLAVGFALIYFLLGSDCFYVSHLDWSLVTVLYYSVVTFTTLGFGDVVPTTAWAAFWVMLEVVFGYIMLGGLISIFATKLARRS